MKNDKEGLAGYVAEMWCYSIMKAIDNKNFQSVCDCFGTSIDKLLKIDMIWRNAVGQICHGDVKASICHPNCSVEADHPFFNGNSNELNYFIFPFRDENFIYAVDVLALKQYLMDNKKPQIGKNGKTYFVVKPNDIKHIAPNQYVLIPSIGKHNTFGDFFNANFKGDEIEDMDEFQIISYVNNFVKDLCIDAVENFDVPED